MGKVGECMKTKLLILVLVVLFPVLTFAQGVVFGPDSLPPVSNGMGGISQDGQFGERVRVVDALGRGGTITSRDTVGEWLVGLPPADGEKFQITVFHYPSSLARDYPRVKGEADQSELLVRDLQNNPSLKAIAAWGHLNLIDASQASQRQRVSEFQVKMCPTICVYPPPGSRHFPYQMVYWQVGYDGDAQTLAQRIMSNLQKFYQTYSPEQCPGPGPCPTPDRRPNRPFRPNTPEPDLTPYVPDTPTPDDNGPPDLPNIWPPVDPDNPTPDDIDVPDETVGEFPEHPQIVVIIDPQGIGEKLAARVLERLAEHIRDRLSSGLGFSGFNNVKARIIRLEDEEASNYPIGAQDTPAIFFTANKRIVGYVTHGVLEAMGEVLTLPAEPPTPLSEQEKALQEIVKTQSKFQDFLDKIDINGDGDGINATTLYVVLGVIVFVMFGGFFGLFRAIIAAIREVLDRDNDGDVDLEDVKLELRNVQKKFEQFFSSQEEPVEEVKPKKTTAKKRAAG